MAKSQDEATTSVKEYLTTANRPYSINDIVNNLQNAFTRPIIVKALEALVSSGDVLERVNGKQKIYFLNQANLDVDAGRLRELDERIEQLSGQIKTLQESNSTEEQKIRAFKEMAPLEELEQKLTDITEEVTRLREQLAECTKRCANVDPDVQKKLQKEHSVLTGEWRRRKRLANEVVDLILEHVDKKRKTFIEEVGIETDEEIAALRGRMGI